jgi:ubiquinone/menaquinone biosynthesis C-methylase UbiE
LLAAGRLAGDVLDIGTGTGRIPIELCRRNRDIRVMAIDSSWQMLDQARINVELEGGLLERIMLDLVDAQDLIYEDGRFQAVLSNHALHQFAAFEVVLRGAFRVTAPRGRIFFRDWLRPEDEATVKHLVRTYAGDENEDQQRTFESSLRAALSLDEIREAVGQIGGDPASVAATSDRHWTWNQAKEPAS